jgi:hypothetical protein
MASIKLPDQYEVTVDFATDWGVTDICYKCL